MLWAEFARIVNDTIWDFPDFQPGDLAFVEALTEKQNMVDLISAKDNREKFLAVLKQKRDELRKNRKPNARL